MLTRREMLTRAAGSIPALTLTGLYARDVLPSCVYTKKTPASGPTPNVIVCGDSCANEGMAGHYPNCYYPQYLNLSRSLANSVSSNRNVGRVAIGNRTVTQGFWNNLAYLHGQWQYHLSLAATQIADCIRIQGIENAMYAPATSTQINAIENWAYNNGFPPNTAAAMVSAALPLATANPGTDTVTQNLHDQIMALPNYGALDNLYGYSNQVAASVTIAPGGICQYLPPATDLIKMGEMYMAFGAIVSGLSFIPTPASPLLSIIGGVDAAGGGMFYVLGELCIR